VEGLKRHELLDKVNIMITADHGMAKTSCNKVIDLDKYVDPENYDFWDSWFNMLLAPKAGKMEDVYKRLKSQCPQIWTKQRHKPKNRFCSFFAQRLALAREQTDHS